MTDGLLEPLMAVGSGGTLAGWNPEPDSRAALTTVVVSGGYPGSVSKGLPITLPEDLDGPDLHVYHAGTAVESDQLVTAGGRVFGVTGIASDLESAAALSRAGASRIEFEGADWRPDIGHSEIA